MSKAAMIQNIESEFLKKDIPDFSIGDSLKIHVRIIEGDKERIQIFQGTVIGRKGAGLSETVMLHRVAYGVGMERLFILNSPKIAQIEVVRKGKVRRAKLYYLRGTQGKKAKVRELIVKKREKGPKAQKDTAAIISEETSEIEEMLPEIKDQE